MKRTNVVLDGGGKIVGWLIEECDLLVDEKGRYFVHPEFGDKIYLPSDKVVPLPLSELYR